MIQLQFVLIVYSANMTHLKSNMKPNNFWIVVYIFIRLSFSNRSCSGSRCLPLVFVGGMGVCVRWPPKVIRSTPSGCNRHIQRSLQCHNALGSGQLGQHRRWKRYHLHRWMLHKGKLRTVQNPSASCLNPKTGNNGTQVQLRVQQGWKIIIC